MLEQDQDELIIASKYSFQHQYKMLLKDTCYVSMLIGTGLCLGQGFALMALIRDILDTRVENRLTIRTLTGILSW